MKKNINSDWFINLKMEIVRLRVTLDIFKQDVVILVLANFWILEDINLFESYTKLQEMIELSDINLESLTKELDCLDEKSIPFAVEDIICEFNFVRDNINLGMFYLFNMLGYMVLVDDYSLSSLEIDEKCNRYAGVDKYCYEQMKANNEQLKILKKERKDYIE